MSRPDFVVPSIILDRTSTLPLQKQVYGQIASAIRNGTLHKGSTMPSTRMLAKLLQVSRNTVVAAYEGLISEGLIQARNRSRVRVIDGTPAPALTLFGLRAVVRAAHYPARIQALEDPDGNSLYINLK